MLDLINDLLGFSLFDEMGSTLGSMIASLFLFLAMEFLIQLILLFWRWMFHVK